MMVTLVIQCPVEQEPLFYRAAYLDSCLPKTFQQTQPHSSNISNIFSTFSAVLLLRLRSPISFNFIPIRRIFACFWASCWAYAMYVAPIIRGQNKLFTLHNVFDRNRWPIFRSIVVFPKYLFKSVNNVRCYRSIININL